MQAAVGERRSSIQSSGFSESDYQRRCVSSVERSERGVDVGTVMDAREASESCCRPEYEHRTQ